MDGQRQTALYKKKMFSEYDLSVNKGQFVYNVNMSLMQFGEN